MNYPRVALAFLGATVAYFVCGFILLSVLPAMKAEFIKYPNVYRPHDDMMKAMPYNMIAILVSIAIVTILYAHVYPAGASITGSLWFGALIGIFAVCIYSIHNYSLLNVGVTLTLYDSLTYFIQWVIVCAVIGLIYKPSFSR